MPTNLDIRSYLGPGLTLTSASDFNLAQLVEKGIPTDSIGYLRENGLTFSEVSSIVISPRTLKHRKSRGEHLSNEETERAIRVARILALAEHIFADRDKALAWLRCSDDRLNHRTPLSMLPTEAGGRLVESMLWRIDEGVYA